MSGTPAPHGRNEERDVRHALGYLVTDEPPLGVGVEDAVTQGRRIRRRHRTTRLAIPVAALALVAVGGAAALVVADDGATAEPQLAVAAAALPLTDAGHASVDASANTGIRSAHGEALLDAVRSAGGTGWTYDLVESKDLGVPSLDGDVDDGAGPARVTVGMSNTTGMFTVHPCRDPEFKAGVSCTETTLADGSYLSVRGLVDYRGIKTYLVGITRDDGTGVSIESGNFVLPPQPASGERVSAADKQDRYAPVISRDLPVFDQASLVAMAKAVARASSGWTTAPMKTNDVSEDVAPAATVTAAPGAPQRVVTR